MGVKYTNCNSYYVKTKQGQLGRAYHEDLLVDKKVPVYCLDAQFNPLRDEEGEIVIQFLPPHCLSVIGVMGKGTISGVKMEYQVL